MPHIKEPLHLAIWAQSGADEFIRMTHCYPSMSEANVGTNNSGPTFYYHIDVESTINSLNGWNQLWK